MTKHRKCLILLVVILCLLTTNNILAADSVPITPAASFLSALSMPDSYGNIKESYINEKSDSLIVHIQDLHANYDAQVSIYNIIDKLVKEHDFKLVTIEGSVGKLESAPFSQYPDEDIKAKVTRNFVKRGRISGSGYAHIMNKSAFALWGVDDPELYAQNVDAFIGSLNSRSVNNTFCDNMKSILDQFKQKAYNKKLLIFDKQMRAYKEDKVSFGEFAQYLNGIMGEHDIEKHSYKNFNKLIEVLKLEKEIDFTQVDTQRSKCVDRLSKKLKDEKLSKLLDMSLHFKTQEIGAVEFYSYLKETVDNTRRVSFDKYPQLDTYISYILSYNEIKHMELFNEINLVQAALSEKMFTRQIEKDIDSLSRNIETLKSLANLKLTTKTLDNYRKNRSSFLASNFINFITKNAPKYRIRYYLNPAYRKIDAQLPVLEKFYTLALERDKALVDNTIKRMGQINTKKAILVAGGFHSEGIAEALKKKGISHLVITPKVNDLDEKNNPYLAIITGKKTPFEEYLYKQAKNRKIENADAFAFQLEAKYLAEAYEIMDELNNKQ